MNSKIVWSSKKRAENAIERYIVSGNIWWLNTNRIWRSVVGNYIAYAPAEARFIAHKIRKEWADKNLIVIPLRDYMVFEHKRAMI